ncbi:MAG: ABC transporter ATP-binding protein [Nitrospirota bacterium]
MIEVKNLSRYFGDIAAINNISFHVNKGEIIGFLGPNGAGKTTTMRILSCFIPMSSGTVNLAGYDIFEDSMEVKKRIGYLPERLPLYKEMTVTEYLEFVLKIKGKRGRMISHLLDNAIERCSLQSVRGRLIGNLSGGYRQRLGLAQAIIHNPEVLIFDEPTIGLDPKQIIEIRELIKELSGEHTVILSTHILPEVTATCQRIIIINEGRIVAEDSQERLSSQLRESEKIGIRIKYPPDDIIERLSSINGVINIFTGDNGEKNFLIVESLLGRDISEELARYVVMNNWGLMEMKSISMSLEDVFLRLTTSENHPPPNPLPQGEME